MAQGALKLLPMRERIATAIAVRCDMPVDEMARDLAGVALHQLGRPDPEMLMAGLEAMKKAECTPLDVWTAMVEAAKRVGAARLS